MVGPIVLHKIVKPVYTWNNSGGHVAPLSVYAVNNARMIDRYVVGNIFWLLVGCLLPLVMQNASML